ncbi:hypothetical protein K504DRAFT_66468 [Pleomassaria siparia CBS 279.74]|uniref:Uncharacterized protein n=1 Tax=Pleomassaria siparia CBS 279.74 TaxID=1314801 RepID=A0A6G1K1U9_9PLEO|nr:hypothetical protein K504DRAFT_66468 [Pleomassaria siparia CBS 279.74]
MPPSCAAIKTALAHLGLSDTPCQTSMRPNSYAYPCSPPGDLFWGPPNRVQTFSNPAPRRFRHVIRSSVLLVAGRRS